MMRRRSPETEIERGGGGQIARRSYRIYPPFSLFRPKFENRPWLRVTVKNGKTHDKAKEDEPPATEQTHHAPAG